MIAMLFLLLISEVFHVEGVRYISEEKYNDFQNLTNFILDGDKTYHYTNSLDSNYILRVFIESHHKTDTHFIQLPIEKIPVRYRNDSFTDIEIKSDTLIVLYRNFIFIYQFDKRKYNFVDSYDLSSLVAKPSDIYSERIILSNGIVVGVNDYFNSKRKNCGFFSWFINLKDSSQNRFLCFPPPKGYYWSIQGPRTLIDFRNETFVCSDITEYNLYFYDMNGKLINSVSRRLNHWQATTIPLENFENKNPQAIWSGLQNSKATLSQIHRVNFIDENTIFVCYSHKFPTDDEDIYYHEFYDIWKKKKGKWELEIADIDAFILDKYGKDTSNSTFERNYVVSEGKIISFHADYDKSDSTTFMIIRSVK